MKVNSIQAKTVGVLGGMGPWATALFFQKLVELTPATKDREHLHVIIDNDPQIPSRTRHFLYHEESPVPRMIADCQRLAAYPVDFIVIPSNNASHFLPQVQPLVTVPIVNIMAITARRVAADHPGIKRVAVLGGAITYHLQTYQPFLRELGLIQVQHSPALQAQVEELIARIKVNEIAPAVFEQMEAIIRRLQETEGAEAVILGCTEFGYLAKTKAVIPVIDSTLELAKFTVNSAKASLAKNPM